MLEIVYDPHLYAKAGSFDLHMYAPPSAAHASNGCTPIRVKHGSMGRQNFRSSLFSRVQLIEHCHIIEFSS